LYFSSTHKPLNSSARLTPRNYYPDGKQRWFRLKDDKMKERALEWLEHIGISMRLFKNVVAQFIGQLCLINQATTKIWG